MATNNASQNKLNVFETDKRDFSYNQYSNLNLNQSHNSSNLNVVQSESITTDSSRVGKNNSNSNDNLQLKQRNDINSCKKFDVHGLFPESSNSLAAFNSFENDSKVRMNDNSPDATNSTLSLHITTYENSNETSNFEKIIDSDKNLANKNDTYGLTNTRENVKELLVESSSKLQIPVETANQRPEVMKFKASQKLLNLNHLKSGKKSDSVPQRMMLNGRRVNLKQQNVDNEATQFMNCIFDRFKYGDKNYDPETEPRQFPDCKISITNLLENGTFLITDAELHYELITKGFYGSRYEAQFDIKLDEKVLLKGEFVWALTPEELVYLACEREIFKVTYPTESGVECYTKDNLYREIVSRNLTNAYRLTVYRKLRSIGFVVRSDNNYGGIFTIYEGSPAKYHAVAIIYEEEDDILEYSAFLRVANTVSKSVIVASLISSPNSSDSDYSDLVNVKVHFTLYDIERPEGLALAFN